MLYRRPALLALSLLTLVGIGTWSCSEVDGCDDGSDCPEPEDEIYEAVCGWREGQDQDTPKVCTYDYKSERCTMGEESDLEKEEDSWPANEKDLNPEQAYKRALLDAYRAASGYVGCDEAGGLGCSSDGGDCDLGLEDVDGTCSDPDSDLTAVEAEKSHAGQDVADQHCRSFFCDETFVCAPLGTGAGHICRPCEEGEAFGEGGCAELYVRGERSPVYLDVDDCKSGESEYGPSVDASDDDDDDTGIGG